MPVLRIRIAGRTLAVRSPVRLGLARPYDAFRVARGSDIAVDVRPGPLPPLPAGTLFRSGGTWTAHALGRAASSTPSARPGPTRRPTACSS